jgi:FAD/FMN-containing dehydrogenase
MTLIGLATLLKPTKYTLPSFPILLNQSVGAAVSTGSHGSSTRFGAIRDSVVALRLVSCEGDVKTIAPKSKRKPNQFLNLSQQRVFALYLMMCSFLL